MDLDKEKIKQLLLSPIDEDRELAAILMLNNWGLGEIITFIEPIGDIYTSLQKRYNRRAMYYVKDDVLIFIGANHLLARLDTDRRRDDGTETIYL